MNIQSTPFDQDYHPGRAQTFERQYSTNLLWRWRNFARTLLPPGLVVFPFQKYPTLRYFWSIDAGMSSSWVRLAWLVVSTLAALDALVVFFPAKAAAMSLSQNTVAQLRLAALPVYMILVALAVSSRCRWWKRGGRLEEMLVTRLESHELLPLLWVPAASKILGVYAVGYLFHVIVAANWPTTLHQTPMGFFASEAPGNLIMALFEFLLALLMLRAAITCSLFASVRSATVLGATLRGLLRACEYIVLAAAGALIPVSLCFFLFVLAWGTEWPLMTYLTEVVSGMALISLLHHLAIDTLEDYDQFQLDWRKWVVRK